MLPTIQFRIIEQQKSEKSLNDGLYDYYASPNIIIILYHGKWDFRGM